MLTEDKIRKLYKVSCDKTARASLHSNMVDLIVYKSMTATYAVILQIPKEQVEADITVSKIVMDNEKQ